MDVAAWTSSDNCFPPAQTDRLLPRGPQLAPPAFLLSLHKRFTNYVDNNNLAQLSFMREFIVSTLEHAPKIAIGSDDLFVYRLVANPFGLMPQDTNLSMTTLDAARHPLLEYCLLGVNLTVQPRQPPLPSNRRRDNRSAESTRSGESTDEGNNQAPGFIFYQLGDLQYASHDHEDSDILGKQPVNMEDYDWQSTGFYLVARLTASGHMGGVYAVYDMFPRSQETGRRQQVEHHQWGVFPCGENQKEHERFPMARIADTLGGLGYERHLKLTERVEYPVELVRVKPAGAVLGAIREKVVE